MGRRLSYLKAMGVRIPFLVVLLAASPPAEVVVSSAVSLREPLIELARAFEAEHPGVRVRLGFGATNVLAQQIRAGAPVDVLLSADERSVEGLVDEGRVPDGAAFVLARNRLVVMRPADARVTLSGPEDLRADGLRRIAIPEYAVPVGRYARDWLARRGLLDALAPRIVATEHARATLAAVDYGHADAAIVYATDARLARSAVVAFEIPDAEQPAIAYLAAPIADSRQRAHADAFLAFLRSERARAALARAGFAAGDS